MDIELRRYFDLIFDEVMGRMPESIHRLTEQIPLVLEDYPSRETMQKLGIAHRSELCGLYTGIPLTDRSVQQSGILSDCIHIYREGILTLANRRGTIDEQELRRQIRITVLHEIGHHHGMDEDDLEELGYG